MWLPYTEGIKILEEAVVKGHKFEFPVYWGVELKNNVKKAWWKKFIQESPYNVGIDAAILMNPQTWVVRSAGCGHGEREKAVGDVTSVCQSFGPGKKGDCCGIRRSIRKPFLRNLESTSGKTIGSRTKCDF